MKHSEAVAAVEKMVATAGGVLLSTDVRMEDVNRSFIELGAAEDAAPGRYAFVDMTIAIPVEVSQRLRASHRGTN